MSDFYTRTEPLGATAFSNPTPGANGTLLLVVLDPENRQNALEQAALESKYRTAKVVYLLAPSDLQALPLSHGASLASEIKDFFAERGIESEAVPTEEDVAEQALTLAEKLAATLIVLGTRRRSAVMKMIMGSAAQRIILQSECPVLTVTG